MTREEAIDRLMWLKDVPHINDDKWIEAIDMAIEALSEDISEDGTLKVKAKDGSKVNRVLVLGDNHFGGLYYPDEGNVQNMHNGMDMEQAIEWCKDCQHDEVCRYYPYDGCQFKDTSERPEGEWIFNPTDAIDLMFAKPKCSRCGFESSDGGNFCSYCGAHMRVGETNPHGFTADEWYRDTFKGEEK